MWLHREGALEKKYTFAFLNLADITYKQGNIQSKHRA